MVHRGPYSYRQRVHAITLLPNIVFVLFLSVLSDFAKARALSSPSRCFQLSTNLGKKLFRYL